MRQSARLEIRLVMLHTMLQLAGDRLPYPCQITARCFAADKGYPRACLNE